MDDHSEGPVISVVHVIVQESVDRIVGRQDELNEMLDRSTDLFRFAMEMGPSKEEVLAAQVEVLMSGLGEQRNAELMVGLLVTATARLAAQVRS